MGSDQSRRAAPLTERFNYYPFLRVALWSRSHSDLHCRKTSPRPQCQPTVSAIPAQPRAWGHAASTQANRRGPQDAGPSRAPHGHPVPVHYTVHLQGTPRQVGCLPGVRGPSWPARLAEGDSGRGHPYPSGRDLPPASRTQRRRRTCSSRKAMQLWGRRSWRVRVTPRDCSGGIARQHRQVLRITWLASSRLGISGHNSGES